MGSHAVTRKAEVITNSWQAISVEGDNELSAIWYECVMTHARSLLMFVACFIPLLAPLSSVAQQNHEFESVSIGAFDPDAWNGIVFESKAYGQRLPFAIRIGSKSGSFLDGSRIFSAVSLVGPHAPDGSYSLIGWRNYPRAATITLEWSRVDGTTVVGRLRKALHKF